MWCVDPFLGNESTLHNREALGSGVFCALLHKGAVNVSLQQQLNYNRRAVFYVFRAEGL
jgi:hypothetical protein